MTKEFKLHLFHLLLIHDQMEALMEALIVMDRSELPSKTRTVLWANCNDLIIIKTASFFEEWGNIKVESAKEVEPKLVEELDKEIKEIEDIWADIKDYRSQIAAHPYGEGYNKPRPSVFRDGPAYYNVPMSEQETLSLINRLTNLIMPVAKYYPEEFKKFNEGIVPYYEPNPFEAFKEKIRQVTKQPSESGDEKTQ